MPNSVFFEVVSTVTIEFEVENSKIYSSVDLTLLGTRLFFIRRNLKIQIAYRIFSTFKIEILEQCLLTQ